MSPPSNNCSWLCFVACSTPVQRGRGGVSRSFYLWTRIRHSYTKKVLDLLEHLIINAKKKGIIMVTQKRGCE